MPRSSWDLTLHFHWNQDSYWLYKEIIFFLSFTLADGTSISTDENVPDVTSPQETNDHNESPSATEVQRCQNIQLFKKKAEQQTNKT